jgi:NAD(P)-dependent dehydrogenase (short-subunit alcohol dehydrogenase family)
MGGIQGSLKFPGLAAYSSSKGAVITLSELLAEEYKEQGIAFNVLALGSVQTDARRLFRLPLFRLKAWRNIFLISL